MGVKVALGAGPCNSRAQGQVSTTDEYTDYGCARADLHIRLPLRRELGLLGAVGIDLALEVGRERVVEVLVRRGRVCRNTDRVSALLSSRVTSLGGPVPAVGRAGEGCMRWGWSGLGDGKAVQTHRPLLHTRARSPLSSSGTPCRSGYVLPLCRVGACKGASEVSVSCVWRGRDGQWPTGCSPNLGEPAPVDVPDRERPGPRPRSAPVTSAWPARAPRLSPCRVFQERYPRVEIRLPPTRYAAADRACASRARASHDSARAVFATVAGRRHRVRAGALALRLLPGPQ